MPSPFKDKERESEGRDDKTTILTPSSFDPLFRGCLKFELEGSLLLKPHNLPGHFGKVARYLL